MPSFNALPQNVLLDIYNFVKADKNAFKSEHFFEVNKSTSDIQAMFIDRLNTTVVFPEDEDHFTDYLKKYYKTIQTLDITIGGPRNVFLQQLRNASLEATYVFTNCTTLRINLCVLIDANIVLDGVKKLGLKWNTRDLTEPGMFDLASSLTPNVTDMVMECSDAPTGNLSDYYTISKLPGTLRRLCVDAQVKVLNIEKYDQLQGLMAINSILCGTLPRSLEFLTMIRSFSTNFVNPGAFFTNCFNLKSIYFHDCPASLIELIPIDVWKGVFANTLESYIDTHSHVEYCYNTIYLKAVRTFIVNSSALSTYAIPASSRLRELELHNVYTPYQHEYYLIRTLPQARVCNSWFGFHYVAHMPKRVSGVSVVKPVPDMGAEDMQF
jgi:hypothetical protein